VKVHELLRAAVWFGVVCARHWYVSWGCMSCMEKGMFGGLILPMLSCAQHSTVTQNDSVNFSAEHALLDLFVKI